MGYHQTFLLTLETEFTVQDSAWVKQWLIQRVSFKIILRNVFKNWRNWKIFLKQVYCTLFHCIGFKSKILQYLYQIITLFRVYCIKNVSLWIISWCLFLVKIFLNELILSLHFTLHDFTVIAYVGGDFWKSTETLNQNTGKKRRRRSRNKR